MLDVFPGLMSGGSFRLPCGAEFVNSWFSRRLFSPCGSIKSAVTCEQHFHFWCIQSNRSQRGFSSRKAAPSARLPCARSE